MPNLINAITHPWIASLFLLSCFGLPRPLLQFFVIHSQNKLPIHTHTRPFSVSEFFLGGGGARGERNQIKPIFNPKEASWSTFKASFSPDLSQPYWQEINLFTLSYCSFYFPVALPTRTLLISSETGNMHQRLPGNRISWRAGLSESPAKPFSAPTLNLSPPSKVLAADFEA